MFKHCLVVDCLTSAIAETGFLFGYKDNRLIIFKTLMNYDYLFLETLSVLMARVLERRCRLIKRFFFIMLLFIFFTIIGPTYKLHENIREKSATMSENAGHYLHSSRFDLLFKMVYAYFYAIEKQVPKVIMMAYEEHLQVWNRFHEYCKNIEKSWYDSNVPCAEKHNLSDFIVSFQKTIDCIQLHGFNSNLSQIPLDKNGFLLNGAHRLAASIVLSKTATFQHLGYEQSYDWGFKFFESSGLSSVTADTIMLEWMTIQVKLQNLNTKVFILSVFSNNVRKDKTMRKIVQDRCSKDKRILYEKKISITKTGARQLITHMYGYQNWLETKIEQILTKLKNSTINVLFIFFYARKTMDLDHCKFKVRSLYNDKDFKSTAHIPDTDEDNLILAQMVLNRNSQIFLNQASNGFQCKDIAQELAIRSASSQIKTLPQMFLGRTDIMIDSGSVLSFFALRKRTDVDILFLREIDERVLGSKHGMTIQAHAFHSNAEPGKRAWGQEHLKETRNEWEFFYDPNNFGYCYGIKFVSLKELIRYKVKRNEPEKDAYDVKLLAEFQKVIYT